MEEIRDCKGRLACKGNAATGFVEAIYKGQKTRTTLPVGETFTIEREGVVTKVIRISTTAFKIEIGHGAGRKHLCVPCRHRRTEFPQGFCRCRFLFIRLLYLEEAVPCARTLALSVAARACVVRMEEKRKAPVVHGTQGNHHLGI